MLPTSAKFLAQIVHAHLIICGYHICSILLIDAAAILKVSLFIPKPMHIAASTSEHVTQKHMTCITAAYPMSG